MQRYAVLPRCGLNDEQTVGARCHGHYHGIVQVRGHADTHFKLGKITAFGSNGHWACGLYSSEGTVPCVAFVRLSRTLRRIAVIVRSFLWCRHWCRWFGPVCFKTSTEPTSCRAHESTYGFLNSCCGPWVLSTGVLLFRARGTIEMLIKLGAYLTLVYANTIGLRSKHKHTCH